MNNLEEIDLFGKLKTEKELDAWWKELALTQKRLLWSMIYEDEDDHK